MIEWSSLFATHIDLVDQQHKILFEMLNGIAAEIEQGRQSSQNLDEAFDELLDYAYQHFIDEEKIMANSHVHPKTMSFQRMEHSSFIFDVKKMRSTSISDDDIDEQFENLVKFVTSWLIYHTLKTDQLVAMEIAQIKKGLSPAAAREYAIAQKLNPAINQKVLEAVLDLWASAAERVKFLEAQLANLQNETDLTTS